MNASDIMTRNVITVGPDTPVADMVALMLAHRISAVPVVENDRLVGIVSEGDMLRRSELATEPKRSRWLEFATSVPTLASEYTKTHGRKVSEVMTREVVAVTADTPIAEIAALLETRGIKRVPVLDQGNIGTGKLVGIVSRANLLQALASRVQAPSTSQIDDRAIRAALFAELDKHKWAATPTDANIVVEGGVVHLWGLIRSEAERQAMIVAAENIPGVRSVEDHMSYPQYLAL